MNGRIDLQATLSASSAGPVPVPQPHHPITCASKLAYHDDGSLACEHATAPVGDVRTAFCVQQSIAILIIEQAVEQL